MAASFENGNGNGCDGLTHIMATMWPNHKIATIPELKNVEARSKNPHKTNVRHIFHIFKMQNVEAKTVGIYSKQYVFHVFHISLPKIEPRLVKNILTLYVEMWKVLYTNDSGKQLPHFYVEGAKKLQLPTVIANSKMWKVENSTSYGNKYNDRKRFLG